MLVRQTAMVRDLSRDGRVGAQKRSGPLTSALSMGRSTQPAREMRASGSQYESKRKWGETLRNDLRLQKIENIISRCAHIAYGSPLDLESRPTALGRGSPSVGGGERIPKPTAVEAGVQRGRSIGERRCGGISQRRAGDGCWTASPVSRR